jgi:hypothetical protein
MCNDLFRAQLRNFFCNQIHFFALTWSDQCWESFLKMTALYQRADGGCGQDAGDLCISEAHEAVS